MSLQKLMGLLASSLFTLILVHSGLAADRVDIVGEIFDQTVAFAADEVTITNAVFHQDVTVEGDVVVEGCLFEGKLFLNSWGTFVVLSSIFENGVEIGGNVADGRLVNNTFVGANGAGVELRSYRNVELLNNIIAFNRTGVSDFGDGVEIRYSDVYDNRDNYFQCNAGEGCISEDPHFLSQEGHDWRLTAGSPCIDAGEPSILDTDSSRSDIGALPLLSDQPVSVFSLLAPENGSHVDNMHVVFNWEPVRYARLYLLKVQYEARAGDLMDSGSVSFVTPLNSFEVDLDQHSLHNMPIIFVTWSVDAVTFSDTIPCRSEFYFGRSMDVWRSSVSFPSAMSFSAYPNPFNSSTTISFTLPQAGRYTISVTDLNGREVARLSKGWRDAGSFREVWNGGAVGSGVYYVKLAGKDSQVLKSVIYLR